MREIPEGTTGLTELKVLIFLSITTLILPIAVLLLCAVLTGLHQYPLSSIYLSAYVTAGLASPMMGLISLVSLFVRKRKFQGAPNRKERRLRGYLLILGILNIFAIVIWAMLVPYVIFSIGGIR